MDQSRSKIPLIIITSVVILSIVVIFLLIQKYNQNTESLIGQTDKDTPSTTSNGDPLNLTADGKTDTHLASTPEELVGRIKDLTIQANDSGNAQPLINFLGPQNLSAIQANHLRQLAASSKLKLDKNSPFSAIEGARNRWTLNLFDRSRILLDLKKNEVGEWHVGKITLPNTTKHVANNGNNRIVSVDPNLPDAKHPTEHTLRQFMNAIIKLDPNAARQHIDTSQVSYAKLACLCIIFEEGQYKLIQDQPFRKMFLRDTTSGWLTRLETTNKKRSAMLAINIKRKDASSPWKITEINLDKLLADYAQHFSDGDIHYTPLVSNPKGGESLVIYFDLNSGLLTNRTQRQLSIVASLLKSDQTKKLTISGHTDALGSDEYNLSLSKKRANTVMNFFAKKGVPATQMKILGFGKAQPRLPNQTKDGLDDPDGRRANRRAEILLDF